ncbi:MAG: hypothetical protein IPJ65_27135 [Archangiaceae bacterium]|nr:hypothetical protein [Archangiaceae bacterium]
MTAGSCGRTLPNFFKQPCVFESDCSPPLHCVNQVCQELTDDGDAGHGHKRFGEPCDAGRECESAVCVGGPSHAFCTERCGTADAGCPFAYECKRAPGVGGPTTPLCTVPTNLLCQTCQGDLDCGASGADLCVQNDGGDSFCGRDCTFAGCPPLYRCEPRAGGASQCVPEKKTCDCLPQTLGLQKGCLDRNAFGACHGSQVCQLDGGFTPCDAPAAQAESCNGNDDDCDGFIDDFTPPTCSKSSNGRTCTGPQVCFASAGLVCNAREPVDEVCNYADDDCNGKADETFTDPAGRYLLTTHCGGCFRDCKQLIPHSTDVSCALQADAGACRVSKCESGYYVNDGGTWCLELPDTLCRPCANDGDCVGPGARCLTIDGEKVCGRDCSTASLYGTSCPSGYACSAGQCQPTTNSCNCKAGVAASRSCAVKTCKGFQSCTGGASPMWSACDVSTFNPEICDGVDNNCDDRVDEGWRNAGTGKYDQPSNCGFCNNDCTKYFSPTLQHTTGVCNAAPAMPQCEMGPCLTETVGGTTFEWVNVDGLSTNGCECRRVQGNTTVDLPDRAPPWADENCDGVDGVVANAVFVSATASAGGNGSRTLPFRTIGEGLAALSGAKRWVLVAQGIYRENLKLTDGAQLFGGYSSDFLKREPKVHSTVIIGQPTGGTPARAALDLDGLGRGAAETVVAGFSIFGWDVTAAPADDANGAPSIAVLLHDCGPNVVLQTNDIFGGRGGEGGRGRTGTQGVGRQSLGTLNGASGAGSRFIMNQTCNPSFNTVGGSGGLNSSCAGSDGLTGGNVVCPSYDMATKVGAEQAYVSPTNGNGAGGFDWSFDMMSGGMCSHVTESGFPTNIQPHDGADGKPNADGTGGVGGAGAASSSRHGTVVNGVWTASSFRPTVGTAGVLGKGGGGAGGGGGGARFMSGGFGGCTAFEIGATGGGGGAGACGGSGGNPGGAGGASIAVLVTYSAATAPAQLPRVTGNRIERGLGGLGGAGGFGGAGGLGGAGGFGGTASRWSSSIGGKGGEGGNGGPGGGGGGGTGGPSFGVLAANVDAASWSAANSFLTPTAANPGGLGGAGGSSPGTGTGLAGVRGATADLLSLTACGGGCGGSATCDNGFCVPN